MKIPNLFEQQTPPISFAAGDAIFKEGEAGSEMYVVKQGDVEIRVKGRMVEVVPVEGFFGEMALIEDGPRTATAIARSDSVLIPINRNRFEFMVHEVPQFAVEVMKGLSRRLRRIDEAA